MMPCSGIDNDRHRSKQDMGTSRKSCAKAGITLSYRPVVGPDHRDSRIRGPSFFQPVCCGDGKIKRGAIGEGTLNGLKLLIHPF